jgi:RNA polymerase sigma-70 factor (ECF subfamily)
MAATIQHAKITGFPALISRPEARVQAYKEAFEANRHRIYSLAFWMTDNEMVAEELMGNTFCRAFATSPDPDAESIDRALMAEIRELMPVGVLTLECAPCTEVIGLRHNHKRVDLERALVQLPATERMIFLLHDVERYDHPRIARTVGCSEQESAYAVHQARLRMRELLAEKA